ncbi:hypothetical protein [Streptomyces hygroscopicus]|uniref:hypothetical protein n=1 Tax=Streptomyces hygroscopicus TaxID=1912 RepID=UPI002240D4C4|nr:hypothetical protein [Streptomyces hygroscopicus]
MTDPIGRLNEIAARWEHGHPELTSGCALCHAEWAEVWDVLHGPSAIMNPPSPPKEP